MQDSPHSEREPQSPPSKRRRSALRSSSLPASYQQRPPPTGLTPPERRNPAIGPPVPPSLSAHPAILHLHCNWLKYGPVSASAWTKSGGHFGQSPLRRAAPSFDVIRTQEDATSIAVSALTSARSHGNGTLLRILPPTSAGGADRDPWSPPRPDRARLGHLAPEARCPVRRAASSLPRFRPSSVSTPQERPEELPRMAPPLARSHHHRHP